MRRMTLEKFSIVVRNFVFLRVIDISFFYFGL